MTVLWKITKKEINSETRRYGEGFCAGIELAQRYIRNVDIGGTTMSERKYLAISIKHTEYKWKFGNECVL